MSEAASSSLAVRVIHQTTWREGKRTRLTYDLELEKLIRDGLIRSGRFAKVEVVRCDNVLHLQPLVAPEEDFVRLGEFPSAAEPQLIKCPAQPAADFFLDIVNRHLERGPHGYAYWAMISFASFMFVPFRFPIEMDMSATLYDRAGNKIGEYRFDTGRGSWYWAPFALFNGFKFNTLRQDPNSKISAEDWVNSFLNSAPRPPGR